MSEHSGIEWTDATWNPVTGCTKVSAGCKNCYAERLAARLQAMGNKNYRNGFAVTLQPHMLEHPLSWKSPKRIFVNSMSDLFHEKVPLAYIKRVFRVMNQADWHQFQILTKRAERLEDVSGQLDWSRNIWMGVSVENEQYLDRNCGGALIIWDRIFGTYAAEGEKVEYGTIEPPKRPYTPFYLELYLWARLLTPGRSSPRTRPS